MFLTPTEKEFLQRLLRDVRDYWMSLPKGREEREQRIREAEVFDAFESRLGRSRAVTLRGAVMGLYDHGAQRFCPEVAWARTRQAELDLAVAQWVALRWNRRWGPLPAGPRDRRSQYCEHAGRQFLEFNLQLPSELTPRVERRVPSPYENLPQAGSAYQSFVEVPTITPPEAPPASSPASARILMADLLRSRLPERRSCYHCSSRFRTENSLADRPEMFCTRGCEETFIANYGQDANNVCGHCHERFRFPDSEAADPWNYCTPQCQQRAREVAAERFRQQSAEIDAASSEPEPF